jgi:hypothetical protein
MNFVEAIEVSKKFPAFHPKIYKGFVEWGICDTETEGYVVLIDCSLAKEPYLGQLENYVENCNLRIDHVDGYLMICTPC